MLHLYSVPFNFSPFFLLLLLHLPQLLSFRSLTHMLVRPLPQTPVLPPLFISLCLRSAVFQQAGCQQGNHSEHRSDNAFALHSQMLQHSSPRATREVLEGKDGWTTPLAIGVRDEMWPVQRSFRRLSPSEVALAL